MAPQQITTHPVQGEAAASPAKLVKTYQPQVLQELLQATKTSEQQPAHSDEAVISTPLTPGSTWQARKAAQRAVLEAQAQAKERAFREAMQVKQKREAEQREASFQALYSEVLGGLACGSGILAEVQEVLDHAAATHHARQAALYQQWSSQVFDTLQERVQERVASTSVQQLEATLRANSDAYIQATNSKLGVFRDVLIEADYDPLQPLRNTIRVPTADLVDPLKRDLLKTQAEKALLSAAAAGNQSDSSSRQLAPALTRATLEVKRWAAGQINATPFGHCIDDATADYVIKLASPADLQQKSSHVHFNDYSNERLTEAYKPSKHMTPPDTNGSRPANLFDLMQGSYAGGGVAAVTGDSWLEHKGKRRVDGPEVAMGRHGLAEVIQQSSNPYLSGGKALDDAWLQPSGKAKVPGPAGQSDLREIIQQSSNPYLDGRALGDRWLEQRGKRRVDPAGQASCPIVVTRQQDELTLTQRVSECV